MFAVDTHCPAGPTFHGSQGHAARIDFIHAPTGLRPRVRAHRVLRPAGSRLQPANALDDGDRRPDFM
eukprot:8865567-Pyramimonas_sp.AAC.1